MGRALTAAGSRGRFLRQGGCQRLRGNYARRQYGSKFDIGMFHAALFCTQDTISCYPVSTILVLLAAEIGFILERTRRGLLFSKEFCDQLA